MGVLTVAVGHAFFGERIAGLEGPTALDGGAEGGCRKESDENTEEEGDESVRLHVCIFVVACSRVVVEIGCAVESDVVSEGAQESARGWGLYGGGIGSLVPPHSDSLMPWRTN